MDRFVTSMINFGMFIYDGPDLERALTEARKCGFEAQVTRNGEPYAFCSPVGGMRRLAA